MDGRRVGLPLLQLLLELLVEHHLVLVLGHEILQLATLRLQLVSGQLDGSEFDSGGIDM